MVDREPPGAALAMKKGYLDTPEGQIHYTTGGTGEPILLLHQTPRSSGMYQELAPILAEEFRVIAMDSLGAGLSDPVPSTVSINDLAANAVHVLDALRIPKAHVFGVHTGATVAGEVAAAWPERVDKLILYGFLMVEGPEREAVVKAGTSGRGMPDFNPADDGAHVMRMWSWAHMQVVRNWWNTKTMPSRELTFDTMKWMHGNMLDVARARDSMNPMHHAVFGYESEKRLPLIDADTLLIEGTGDFESVTCRRTSRLEELIPKTTSAELAGGDANVADFFAPQLAELMVGFLRGK